MMHSYTVHMYPPSLASNEEKVVFVKEGFSWTAFIFTVFYALYYRLWGLAFLCISFFILLSMGEAQGFISEPISALLQLGFLTYTGFEANDFRRESLKKRGIALVDIVMAPNHMLAEQRFFDRHLSLLGPRTSPL